MDTGTGDWLSPEGPEGERLAGRPVLQQNEERGSCTFTEEWAVQWTGAFPGPPVNGTRGATQETWQEGTAARGPTWNWSPRCRAPPRWQLFQSHKSGPFTLNPSSSACGQNRKRRSWPCLTQFMSSPCPHEKVACKAFHDRAPACLSNLLSQPPLKFSQIDVKFPNASQSLVFLLSSRCPVGLGYPSPSPLVWRAGCNPPFSSGTTLIAPAKVSWRVPLGQRLGFPVGISKARDQVTQ